jgi:hypothetical protein
MNTLFYPPLQYPAKIAARRSKKEQKGAKRSKKEQEGAKRSKIKDEKKG